MAFELKTNNEKNLPNIKRWFMLTALFLLALLAVGALAFTGLAIGLEMSYKDKFYPGVSVDSINLAGKTKAQAMEIFNNFEDKFQNEGIIIEASNKQLKVTPQLHSENDSDYIREIVTFDWDQMVSDAFDVGREGNWFDKFSTQIKTYLSGKKINVKYILNTKELNSLLESTFSPLAKAPANAELTNTDGKIEILEEQNGYIFNYAKAQADFENDIKNLKTDKIILESVYSYPLVKKSEAQKALPDYQKILALAPIKLKYQDKDWEITQARLVNTMEFQMQDNRVVIGLNKEKIQEFLKTIASEIDIAPQDAKFQMVDNKVTEFQAGQNGQILNLDTSYDRINALVISQNPNPIELIVDETKGKIATGDVNNIGISDLMGRGTSNFKGSPKNRRINIATGAKILNGILIAPNEEFSMIKALGPIDGEHGFKQELVIKGNKTIPEYGGGLCQIGTTAFRAALNSGLPITMRRNHSYRVTYYEPAGLDATIYDPLPDLRFLNDTSNYILFTTKVDGDNLYFDFYGTKDGRTVELSPNPPRIYNVTSPGPIKYVQTDTLKPGEKKKQETAHKGADTYFKYTVTYPNGEIKEKEFTSHYVPWPEVWLVGAEVASSTPATVDGSTAPVVTPAI